MLRAMSKCYVTWLSTPEGNDYWVCSRYGAGVRSKHLPHTERCYYDGCPGRSDKPTQQPVPQVVAPASEITSVCAWFKCSNPVAPNKLRHCSEVCRKRQNRHEYKVRQRAMKSESKGEKA